MTKFVALGHFRRDVIILGIGESLDEASDIAKAAVASGNAAEACVVETLFFTTESEIVRENVDGASSGSSPLVNPHGDLTPEPSPTLGAQGDGRSSSEA